VLKKGSRRLISMVESFIQNSTLRLGEAVLKGVSFGTARLVDMPISAQTLLCLSLFQTYDFNILWVASDVRDMERLHETLQTFGHPLSAAHLFRPMEKDPAVFGEHLKLVQHLNNQERLIIITCPQALEQEIPLSEKSEEAVQTLCVGDEYKLEDLTDWMTNAGYEFGVEVYTQGEAALRGGILDCWPPGSPRPVRIEFLAMRLTPFAFSTTRPNAPSKK
jgi:transcription-repair coupling factor (superfamily II helicase)